MRRIFVLPLVILLCIAVVSCNGTTNGNENGGNGTNDSEPLLGPDDNTWVSPGAVEIHDFFAGARTEYALTIHNGRDVAAEFSLTYQLPGSTREGYIPATSEVESWVTITEPSPVLIAKETRDIIVILEIPAGAQTPGDNWEFWIVVKDVTQGDLVQVQLAIRWLVDMR